MISRFLAVTVLAAPATLFAQNQPVSPNQAPVPASTVVAPSTNIYVVGGGLYGGGVYVVNGAAVPAEATTGISLAGRAGVNVNQPMDLGVQSTLAPSAPVHGYGYGYSSPAAGYAAGAVSTAEAARKPANDLGPASFEGSATSTASALLMSLGEVAAQYRANRHQNIRTFTNADAERIVKPVTLGSVSATENAQAGTAPVVVAENRPEPAPAQPREKATATTPEIAPAASPAANTTLPATSSFLPLLSLLGILSGGVGLWVRRFLK